MAENEISNQKIQAFASVTGVAEERAKFYLEASNGDLEVAIGSYFENSEVASNNESGSTRLNQHSHEDDDDDDNDEADRAEFAKYMSSFKESNASKAPKESSLKNSDTSRSRIHTLASMREDRDDGESHGHDEDDDSEEDKGQAYYAGGSETSGQQIIGPAKKSRNPENVIKDLFRKAKESGAQEVDGNIQHGATSSSTAYGTGYRLGTGKEPTEIIKGPDRPKPPRVNILKLWKNGFSVDDGDLRSYDDPQNKEFLDSIKRGIPPRELLQEAEGAEVHLDMQDHRDSDFEPPKNKQQKYKLYNDGYKLGSTSTAPITTNTTLSEKVTNEQAAIAQLGLDESRPVTQIQIRLSDGSRVVVKANQTHTITDLRRFINTSRPEYNQRSYALMTSFPNRELTNNEQTLQEAGLLNAVIMQKLA